MEDLKIRQWIRHSFNENELHETRRRYRVEIWSLDMLSTKYRAGVGALDPSG